MNKESYFNNQVVLISGGLGDIGLATVKAFARQGARVAIGDRLSPEAAALQLARLQEVGYPCRYDQVDVQDAEAVEQWVESIAEHWGKVDIAIANAATVTLKDYQQISPAEWDQEIKVNLNGSFYLANAVARKIVQQGSAGNIVFLGSWAAHVVHQNLPAYSVSKAAIRMLCQSMALEYASHGIRINEVAPGYVNAGLSKEVWSQHPGLADQARETVPVRALIEAEEVADQVVWICHPKNRHLTGSTILMDGGLSLSRKS
ncbi:SDR family NAD(P)-dependent oxidoreductase [Sphingobacterium spiritivorum]|uniref:SDR family NAD(P)-dependent oxidoreductase n=1 Tax=Sphingobacterium spiritivorum TaxID=258 RepID=UPI003DA5F0B3